MAHALTLNSGINGAGLFDRARVAFSQYRTYLRTVNELQALNARELSDLGIQRANIREIARSAAYGL